MIGKASPTAQERIAFAYASRDFARVRDEVAAMAPTSSLDTELLGMGANAALQLRDFGHAVAWLGAMLDRQPEDLRLRRALSMAHNNRGIALRAQEEVAAARADYARALRIWPDNEQALFNLAADELDSLQPQRAATQLARLRTLRPQDREVLLLELEASLAAGNEGAREALRRELRQDVDSDLPALARCRAQVLVDSPLDGCLLREPLASPSERVQLASLLCENGRWREARSVYADLANDLHDGARSPGLFARFGAQLALPSVYESRADLEAADASFDAGIGELESSITDAALARCEPGLAQARWCDVAAAHRVGTLREAQTRLGNLLAQAAARLAVDHVPAMARPLPKRPRVGFIGQCFRNCAGGAYFGNWIRAVRNAGFETHLFQIGPKYDEWTVEFEAHAEYATRLEGDLDGMAAGIAARRLDLIVYPELGGNHRVQALASLRLAPRQACGWGVPVTSGLPTIDAFITCAAMEPDSAEAHYSEAQLIRLPHIGTHYRPPAIPPLRTRSELGLPEAERLYFAPHTPLKLHVDGDAVLAQVAARDPDARCVLFRPYHHGAFVRLRARLAQAMEQAGADPARLLFLSTCSRERYLQLAAACDVMVDSPHWSGGNSTLDCLLMKLPVVTVAGECMRGRQSTGMLDLIGFSTELVCHDADAQVARAIEIATHRDFATSLRATLASRVPYLHSGDEALDALQHAVRGLLGETS